MHIRLRYLLQSVVLLAASLIGVAASAQAVREFPLPANRNYYGVAVGADGTAWISEFGNSAIAIRKPNGSVIEASTISRNSQPAGLQLGPDGNIWFVEVGAHAIGVMQPNGTMLHEWTTRCNPIGALAVGSGSFMWFSESCASSEYITKITMTGMMSMFQIGTDASRRPFGLVEKSDGSVWFVEQLGNAVGHLDPKTGHYAEFAIPTPHAFPYFLSPGPDGNLWFPELLVSSNKLARIDGMGAITEFDWDGDAPASLAVDRAGTFWAIDTAKGLWQIKVSPGGISRLRLGGRSEDIVTAILARDAKGDLWFSESAGCALGYIDPTGIFNDKFDGCP